MWSNIVAVSKAGRRKAVASTKQQTAVRALFTRIAGNYDTVNRLISLGQDQRLRRLALKATQVPRGGRLLDVGTGTGDVALQAAEHYPGRQIVGVDPTAAMVRQAQAKHRRQGPQWSLGDGLQLPFPDAAFDAVISAFMMRNVPDVLQALTEQVRVVRPGGRVVCLEMTWPRRFPMSTLFRLYFFKVAPLIGQMFSGNRAAYMYLPRSVRSFMSPKTLAGHMYDAGLHDVRWTRHMLGTATIHVGLK